ncbi:MAG TPA: ABC transporter ATP-binding protein [Candidatus Hydrogenedentes bacterium]|nr:ABC transporter ATP-binding protein [Candidatus Hydrogenedentota bacterium]HPG67580.1 ABC transporter ATP-binding protein [Candidatus Hydrogenedentota bacterium]
MSTPVRIEALAGAVGAFRLLPVTLDVIEGEYLVLLGPSGCGKTTLLELLCGLRKPQSGRVYIGGRDVTHADPAERHIGYVPQDYQLFGSRTTEWNLRFAARLRQSSRFDASERLASVIRMLRLEPLLRQPAQTLSGGEQQRVALGRALMANPDVLLLDEPVSALPESMRDQVCLELKRLQREFQLTTVHVCHNLDEALTVGDRLALMEVGRLVQVGPPDEVLDRPVNRFVAEFTHCRNSWPVEVSQGMIRLGGIGIAATAAPAGAYHAVIRPEHVVTGDTGHACRVISSERRPYAVLTRATLGDVQLALVDDRVHAPGEIVRVVFPPERIHLVTE